MSPGREAMEVDKSANSLSYCRCSSRSLCYCCCCCYCQPQIPLRDLCTHIKLQALRDCSCASDLHKIQGPRGLW
jgi:hypothetical protein